MTKLQVEFVKFTVTVEYFNPYLSVINRLNMLIKPLWKTTQYYLVNLEICAHPVAQGFLLGTCLRETCTCEPRMFVPAVFVIAKILSNPNVQLN